MSASHPAGAGPPPTGPPYPQKYAQLGGRPTRHVDIPVCAMFIVFFLGSAVINMTIFQKNKKIGHKFIPSVLFFGFSMARLTALSMRIAWTIHIKNINLALASAIFVAAGVLLLFVVNLLFAQRIVRAYHPKFGWKRTVTLIFRSLLGTVVALLVMVITSTVYSFFTLDDAARQKCRNIQLFTGVYLAVIAFLPLPIVGLTLLWPGKNRREVEKFGNGRMRTKLALLITTSTLLSLGAWFRAATNFVPREPQHPAWYHSKACFYFFNFGIEVIVVYLYALSRFDRRFHVPDGSSKPGHYSGIIEITKEGKFIHSGSGESSNRGPSPDADDGEEEEKEEEERHPETRNTAEIVRPPKKEGGSREGPDSGVVA
ncbi:hypothetical protein QBC35DRAFT_450126 [Podospora australis]|uniref:Family c-likeg-protein-coupled receptor protein n=1 Tax=Podospora australis TaxID=1536484 RepID=A0AAN7ALC7_9PEZI|nr:hypothetical protein QBC35DRAFT_450126 [Podospora australis]